VKKRALVKKILLRLHAELLSFAKAARTAHAEATHEQNKAESKYDTRGLEAAYLAGGQARQAAETEKTIEQFQTLPLSSFGAKDPIALSALVELEARGERMFYFLGPRGGGLEIQHGGKEILLITPQSPIGQLLLGRKTGDRVKFGTGAQQMEYRVLAVS